MRSTTRSRRVATGLGGLRTKCAQIIGVSDSDTAVETAIANARVTENSRNTRPTRPVMNNSGMKAATSDMLIEITVNPICRAPSMAARNGDMPFSRLRKQFSIMTIASSTTKPTATASAMSERLSIEKPAAHIIAQVPASDSGTVTPAATVVAVRRKNTNTTSMTRTIVARSVSCMSRTLARIVWVRSESTEMSMPTGIQRLISGSSATIAHSQLDRGDRRQPHHRAVGGAYRDGVVVRRAPKLVVGGDGDGTLGAVESTNRPHCVGVRDRGAHVLESEAHRGERDRIDPNANGRLLGAIDGDLSYPFDLREPLRDHAIGGIVEHAGRKILGRQRQNHDRRCRRIGFAKSRR